MEAKPKVPDTDDVIDDLSDNSNRVSDRVSDMSDM